MTRDILKLTAIFIGAAVMTACTALGHGHGYSRYGDHQISASAGHYLRPAPYQAYYFGYPLVYHNSPQPVVVETARTRFQPRPQYVYYPEPVAPRRVKFVNNITQENGVMVHRPAAPVVRPQPAQSLRHIEIAPEPVTSAPEYTTQETYVFEAAEQVQAPVATLTEPAPDLVYDPLPEFDYESSPDASDVDISYVKINGSSDITDWEACETDTGGYVEWTRTGYVVDPAFDNCMRIKGYKPESEAEETLAGGN